MRVGIWHGGTLTTLQRDLPALLELGISRVAIMATDSTAEFRLRFSKGAFDAAIRELWQAGMDVILTAWALASPPWVERMANELPELADAVGASTIEIDAEGDWVPGRGYRNLQNAADDLYRRLEDYQERGGVVSVAPHTGRLQLELLEGRCDEVALQCYSRVAMEPEYRWGAWAGPGHLQRRGIAALEKHALGKAWAIGLAAYLQRFPDHTVGEAMQEAWGACEQGGIEEVRYWYWNALKRGEARAFLQEKMNAAHNP